MHKAFLLRLCLLFAAQSGCRRNRFAVTISSYRVPRDVYVGAVFC